jgi:hydroxymethylpyrimidine/phosphomethylpyrimidine kinase
MPHYPRRVLAIGGSDSGGSAGIQADLKTYAARDVFGCTAITVVTAQDTNGVQAAHALPEDFVQSQIDVVLQDIGADVVKTGLLGRASIVQLVAEALRNYSISLAVVDPVIMNGKNEVFVSPETIDAYKTLLFPLATVITPNLDEAALLAGMMIQSMPDMYEAARRLHDLGTRYVLVKGGHFSEGKRLLDLVYDGKQFLELTAWRLPVENPHGVGCTFASAIAAELAKGEPPLSAVSKAHKYLQRALARGLSWQVGHGRPPVNHSLR